MSHKFAQKTEPQTDPTSETTEHQKSQEQFIDQDDDNVLLLESEYIPNEQPKKITQPNDYIEVLGKLTNLNNNRT